MNPRLSPLFLERTHLVATVGWASMLPVSIVTGWLWSIAFVSACSIYANFAGHASSWQAARAERRVEENGEG